MTIASDQLQAWLNGTPTGGPNGDGRYPLTYADGTTHLVLCPKAQAIAEADLTSQPQQFAENAAASATAASTSADEAVSAQTAAESARDAAVDAQTAAASSETAAAGSASAAATSASDAVTSASNAKASEAAAAASQTAAGTSEANALASQNAAATSASNASTSEVHASASKDAAAASESNAKTSETNAAASQSAAADSASAAATSATNAKTSETNAASSASDAAGSASAASGSATSANTAAGNAASSATAAAQSASDAASARDAAAASAASINPANLVHTTGDETVGGNKTFTSGLSVAPPSGVNPVLSLRGAEVGRVNYISSTLAGKGRWGIALSDGAAETGANAGSDFKIDTFNDDGSYKTTVLTIKRSTGDVGITTVGSAGGLTITDFGSQGAGIWLKGNGAATPNKYIRSRSGYLEIVNSNNSAIIWNLGDSGDMGTFGNIAMANGKGLVATGGAKLTTGPAGGTWSVTPANASSAAFGINDSTGASQWTWDSNGNAATGSNVTLSFASKTRQMINLWGTAYGVGVQNSTLYLRGTCFAWHVGGAHSDTQNDPGTGGRLAMWLEGPSAGSRLHLLGSHFHAAGVNAVLSCDSGGIYLRPNGPDNGSGQVLIDGGGSVNAAGAIFGNRLFTGWDSGTLGAVSCNNWFRASGQTGLYFNDYGGGWYMTDGTYIRAYNGKAVAAADFVIASDPRGKAGIRPLTFRGPLKPKQYVRRADGVKDFGFLTPEVEELYPEAVSYGSDGAKLSYGKLTAVLSAQLNALEARVKKLERDLAAANEPRRSWWRKITHR